MSRVCRYYIVIPLILTSLSSMSQILDKTRPVKFLALGDSYTIGESVEENHRWPVQLIDALKSKGYSCLKPTIIATTGWRTDDLKKAIEAARPAKDFSIVSLLIGVNNQYQGKSAESYAPEFEDLLQTAIECAGGNRSGVFVVSIPDYGFTPFGKEKQPAISSAIDEFNAVNKSIAEKYGIRYFDITGISRRGLAEPSLVANDGLHPSAAMYAAWVSMIMSGL